MEQISGEIRDGEVTLHRPIDWPDGTQLLIFRAAADVESAGTEHFTFGMDESEWPSTPDELQEWIVWCEGLQPLDLTPHEQAAIEAEREQSKRESIAMVKSHWEQQE